MRAAFDRKSMAAIQETIESRRVASPNYLVEPVVSPPPPPVSLSRASFRAKSENDVLAEVTAWPMKSLHRPGLGMDSSPAAATTLAARRKLALLRLPISDSSHEAVELKTFRTKLAAIEKRMLAAAAVEDIAAVTECLAEGNVLRAAYDRKKIAEIQTSMNSRRQTNPNWWRPLTKIVIGPIQPWPLGPQRIHFHLPRNHCLAPRAPFSMRQPHLFFDGLLPPKLRRKLRGRIVSIFPDRLAAFSQASMSAKATFIGDVVVKHLRGRKNRVTFRPAAPRKKSERAVNVLRLPKRFGECKPIAQRDIIVEHFEPSTSNKRFYPATVRRNHHLLQAAVSPRRRIISVFRRAPLANVEAVVIQIDIFIVSPLSSTSKVGVVSFSPKTKPRIFHATRSILEVLRHPKPIECEDPIIQKDITIESSSQACRGVSFFRAFAKSATRSEDN